MNGSQTVTPFPKTRQDHLAFYLEHGISPVHQDISDLDRHLQRRGSLYRSLGVPPQLLRGARVLEFGPGSGHNSLYVAACQPEVLDLVEPNPVGAREIAALYAGFTRPHTPPRVIAAKLETFPVQPVYDVVIAEAWLGIPDHERQLRAKLSRYLRPGGIVITTVTPPVGMLSNILRRILANRLTQDCATLQEKTGRLVAAFGSHLETLTHMSRPPEDWVQDTIIGPGFLTSPSTPAMVFDDLGPTLSIYHSFPRFAPDWRWYKALYGKERRFNAVYLDAYYATGHNFFDFRTVLPDRAKAFNRALEQDSLALVALVTEYEERSMEPPHQAIRELLHAIQARLRLISEAWAGALQEFLTLFEQREITTAAVAAMPHFRYVFGRELIYLSALRDDG